MTTAQKVIKYLAIAFAIFLIISIISGIVNVGYVILTSTGLIKEKNVLLEDLITISDNVKEVATLKVEINGARLKLVEGNEFKVETNNSKITYSNDSGSVVIKEKGKTNIRFNSENNSILIITIPKEMKAFDETSIETGAGFIEIDCLKTQGLNFDFGAGKVDIKNLEVTADAKINAGAGELNIENSKIKNLNLNLGIGETNIKSELTGRSKIETGVGELNLTLALPEKNYKISAEKGLGEIKLNNKKISDDSTIGNGENYIKINGGIGAINIKTVEN